MVREFDERSGRERPRPRNERKGRRYLVKVGRWEVLLDELADGLREVSRSALPLGEPMMQLPDPERGHQAGKQQTS